MRRCLVLGLLVLGCTPSSSSSGGSGDTDGGIQSLRDAAVVTDGGGVTGDGTITRQGAAQAYVVDGTQSELLLLVRRKPTVGCGGGHAHVVVGTQVGWTVALNGDTPGAGTFSADVLANGLEPDRAADRARFPETANQDVASFRDEIRGSVRGQVDATRHPVLTFAARDLSTLSGAGTANVDVTIKGMTSTIAVTATATWTGDALTITGEGVLDGAPHGIPSGAVGACLEPLMPMHFTLALVPAV